MTLNPNTSLAFNESKRKISGILNRKGKPIQQTEAPVSTTSYGSRNISPQRCLGPNSWNLVICYIQFSSVQFSSAAQSCPTLCDTMNCSTPGLPVDHQL